MRVFARVFVRVFARVFVVVLVWVGLNITWFNLGRLDQSTTCIHRHRVQAGGAFGPLRGEARRPAQGYFLSLIISRVRELQWAFAASIEPVYHGVASIRVRGTTDRLLVCVAKAAGKRCSSGTGSSKGRVVRVSSLV